MDGKKVTIVAILAILVGLLIGYLFWGARLGDLAGEHAQLKGRLAEAQQAATREKELSAKLQGFEGQLRQLSDLLAAEKEKREKLEAQVAKGQK